MVAEINSGEKGELTHVPKMGCITPETRIKAFEREFFDLAERHHVTAEIMATLRDAMRAQTTLRVPKDGKWTYEWTPDHAVRGAAARTLAEILRLMPKGNGVTVNHGPIQTVNITATDRLAELDSIGVPREEIARACQDLLQAAGAGVETGNGEGQAGKATDASVPETPLPKVEESDGF